MRERDGRLDRVPWTMRDLDALRLKGEAMQKNLARVPRVSTLLEEAGVPRRYREARLVDFPGLPPVDWRRGGYFLSGNPGVGKTHLAVALLASRLVIDHPDTLLRETDSRAPSYYQLDTHALPANCACWATSQEVLCRLRATYRDGASSTEAEVVRAYQRPAFLILDDLGSEKITDWSASALYLILQVRDAEMRHTVVTSNQDIGEIALWEPRIASRLAGMATLPLPDVDRRLCP